MSGTVASLTTAIYVEARVTGKGRRAAWRVACVTRRVHAMGGRVGLAAWREAVRA